MKLVFVLLNSSEKPILDMLLDNESKFFEKSLLKEKKRKKTETTIK